MSGVPLSKDDPFGVTLEKYKKKDLEEKYKIVPVQEQASSLNRYTDEQLKEAQKLNSEAWRIVNVPNNTKENLLKALDLVRRANNLTHGERSGILDTLARAHFELKEYGPAVGYQSYAVELIAKQEKWAHSAARNDHEFQITLRKYKAALDKYNKELPSAKQWIAMVYEPKFSASDLIARLKDFGPMQEKMQLEQLFIAETDPNRIWWFGEREIVEELPRAMTVLDQKEGNDQRNRRLHRRRKRKIPK